MSQMRAPDVRTPPDLAPLFARSAQLHAPLLREHRVVAGPLIFTVAGAELRTPPRRPVDVARHVVSSAFGYLGTGCDRVYVNGEAFDVHHRMSGFSLHRPEDPAPPGAPGGR